MAKRIGLLEEQRYNQGSETVTASGALHVRKRKSKLDVSATKAYTLAAPWFIGQRKIISTIAAASTPVATVAVASCNGAGGAAATRTFSGFGTISASAPKTLELESDDGATWTPISMIGVTVA